MNNLFSWSVICIIFLALRTVYVLSVWQNAGLWLWSKCTVQWDKHYSICRSTITHCNSICWSVQKYWCLSSLDIDEKGHHWPIWFRLWGCGWFSIHYLWVVGYEFVVGVFFPFLSCSRGEQVTADSSESYEMLLQSSLGFSNPSNVDYLLGKLGISDTKSHSLMRGLQRYTVLFFFLKIQI